VQAAQREAERVGRRLVEPLRIVDREHGRLLVRGIPEHRGDAGRDGAGVDHLAARVLEEERDRERAPLRRRQPVECARTERAEQVEEAGERQRRLRAGRPRREDARAVRRGEIDARLPESGLADAGRAEERERGDAVARLGEEPLDRLQLTPTPDERGLCPARGGARVDGTREE
jgi:hypothetical protein